MSGKERRRYRRIRLRLPVTPQEGDWLRGPGEDVWTSNISAGGMYLHVPGEPSLPAGSVLWFELQVPPGTGYASTSGTIRGAGQVIRTDPIGRRLGVALKFTQPLAMNFQ